MAEKISEEKTLKQVSQKKYSNLENFILLTPELDTFNNKDEYFFEEFIKKLGDIYYESIKNFRDLNLSMVNKKFTKKDFTKKLSDFLDDYYWKMLESSLSELHKLKTELNVVDIKRILLKKILTLNFITHFSKESRQLNIIHSNKLYVLDDWISIKFDEFTITIDEIEEYYALDQNKINVNDQCSIQILKLSTQQIKGLYDKLMTYQWIKNHDNSSLLQFSCNNNNNDMVYVYYDYNDNIPTIKLNNNIQARFTPNWRIEIKEKSGNIREPSFTEKARAIGIVSNIVGGLELELK